MKIKTIILTIEITTIDFSQHLKLVDKTRPIHQSFGFVHINKIPSHQNRTHAYIIYHYYSDFTLELDRCPFPLSILLQIDIEFFFSVHILIRFFSVSTQRIMNCFFWFFRPIFSKFQNGICRSQSKMVEREENKL